MSKEVDEFLEKQQKDIDLERRKKAVQEKELDLKEKRIDIAFSDLVKNKEESEKSKSVSFGRLSDTAVEELIENNTDYLLAAKHPIPFICSEFDSLVPFFRKNLLLIMAATGSGKSTAVCCITFKALKTINPLTGKGYRILILSNEESSEDLINRLCCYSKGWKYTNHDKFDNLQRDEFNKYIRVFAQKGNLTVIGDRFENVSGWTTTVEGIVQVFDNLIRDKDFYDVVILDYYQNVVKSREQPELNEFQVQRLLSNEFDRIKNVYPGAIVVMAQCDPLSDSEDTTPYSVRLKGTKMLVTKSTFICEIIPEHKLLRSKWRVHKSRFTEAVGKEIITGFWNGRYVPYSIEFQKKVAQLVEQNLERDKERELGMAVDKEKESDTLNEGEIV